MRISLLAITKERNRAAWLVEDEGPPPRSIDCNAIGGKALLDTTCPRPEQSSEHLLVVCHRSPNHLPGEVATVTVAATSSSEEGGPDSDGGCPYNAASADDAEPPLTAAPQAGVDASEEAMADDPFHADWPHWSRAESWRDMAAT